jgi:hypothetical protein
MCWTETERDRERERESKKNTSHTHTHTHTQHVHKQQEVNAKYKQLKLAELRYIFECFCQGDMPDEARLSSASPPHEQRPDTQAAGATEAHRPREESAGSKPGKAASAHTARDGADKEASKRKWHKPSNDVGAPQLGHDVLSEKEMHTQGAASERDGEKRNRPSWAEESGRGGRQQQQQQGAGSRDRSAGAAASTDAAAGGKISHRDRNSAGKGKSRGGAEDAQEDKRRGHKRFGGMGERALTMDMTELMQFYDYSGMSQCVNKSLLTRFVSRYVSVRMWFCMYPRVSNDQNALSY